ncbi:MAG TPA: MBL fold metallo-hydrolase [Acidimicrobiales bacterium]|nr:MBL fold metallo-hydrolase [Acidimicrobiales bacterium]
MDDPAPTGRLYFRQLLSGQDFAEDDPVARQMVNFVYAVGDRATGEALLVDPAYRVEELLGIVESDGMRCAGVLATHYHFDHVGGSAMGWEVEGIAALLERVQVPVHVQRAEVPWVVRATGVSDAELVAHDGGDVVTVGEVAVELVHTPGHTPGSQCFLVDGHLVSGDTLFLQGCGRTDLPGGDPEALYESLTQRLVKVPDGTLVYPGHRYAEVPSASMGETRRTNVVFRPRSAEEWLAMFGR